jgi:RHS repeat-associated protein
MLWQGSAGAMRGWTARYEWTNEGELTRVADSMRGTTTYRYDAAHRLVAETTPTGARLELELDGADALRFKHDVGRLELTSGNRLVASDDEVFEHDARDHLCARRRRSTGEASRYVYDAFDMLVRIERTGGAGDLVSSFEYDAIGRRLVARHGRRTRHFVWDGDRLAAEVSPTGALRIYQYASPTALVPITFTDYASVDADPSEGRTFHLFADPTGQPLVVQDERGHMVWSARRVDPYGLLEVAPESSLELNLRWPGHYFDPETGLHYNRYRYYDPRLGRYLQTDPLGYGGSASHLYGAPTNPLRDVDVLGLAHPDVTDGSTKNKGSDNYGTEDPPGFQRTRPGSPDGKVPPLDLEGPQLQKLKAAHAAHLDAASQANPNAGHIKGVSPADIDLARQPGNTPEQIDARRRILTEFVAPQDVNNHIKGHDLTQPLFVGPPPPAPAQQTQYQTSKDPRGPGQYFADSGFTPNELVIASHGGNPPVAKTAFPTSNDPNTPYLQSSNAATYDTWSQPGQDIWTHGGGVQRVYTHQNGGKSWL